MLETPLGTPFVKPYTSSKVCTGKGKDVAREPVAGFPASAFQSVFDALVCATCSGIK